MSREYSVIRSVLRNPTHLSSRSISIDTRALAIFRISVALLVIADIFLRARNFSFLYTEDGVVPQELAMRMAADNAFSIYYFTTSTPVIAALFALTVLIALQLLVGYKTRLATIMTFLLVISLDHHNPLVLSYADVLFRFLLFWAIFLPLGERWSIDAVHRNRGPRSAITSLASAAILLQIVYMYFFNGLHKTESALWTGGEATVLIMGLDNTTFLLGEFTRNFPTLLQYGGLAWYYMLLFSPLLLVLRGWARTAFVAMFMGGHLSFALTVRIGAFPYVALAGLVLFLQTPFWNGVERTTGSLLARSRFATARTDSARTATDRSVPARLESRLVHVAARIPSFRPDFRNPRTAEFLSGVRTAVYTVAVIAAVVSILVVPALSHAPIAGTIDEDHEDRIDDAASIVNVDQPDWTVFAPHPRTVDRYYVFPATTENGENLDVYSDRPLTDDRPYEELQRQFGTYRERFYMSSVRRGGPNDVVAETLAEYLCENSAENLTHVNMYYVVEDVTLETIDDHEERDSERRPIYRHGCDGNDPTEIEFPDDAGDG